MPIILKVRQVGAIFKTTKVAVLFRKLRKVIVIFKTTWKVMHFSKNSREVGEIYPFSDFYLFILFFQFLESSKIRINIIFLD